MRGGVEEEEEGGAGARLGRLLGVKGRKERVLCTAQHQSPSPLLLVQRPSN